MKIFSLMFRSIFTRSGVRSVGPGLSDVTDDDTNSILAYDDANTIPIGQFQTICGAAD